MASEIDGVDGTGLAVDEHKNVFIVNNENDPKAYLGQIIYHNNEAVFLPSSETPNGETGTLAFSVNFMKKLIDILETIQEKPSDEEIDTLFNGNQI